MKGNKFLLLWCLCLGSLSLWAHPKDSLAWKLLDQAQEELYAYRIGNALYQLGQAQNLFEQQGNWQGYYRSIYAESQCYQYTYRINKALDFALQHRQQAQAKLSPKEHLLLACFDANIGQSYAQLRLQDSAHYYFQRAAQLAEEHSGTDRQSQLDQAEVYSQLQKWYQQTGQWSKSLLYLDQAQKAYRQALPNKSPQLFEVQLIRAELLWAQGRLRQALQIFDPLGPQIEKQQKAMPQLLLRWGLQYHRFHPIKPQTRQWDQAYRRLYQSIQQHYGKRSLPAAQMQAQWGIVAYTQALDSSTAHEKLLLAADVLKAQSFDGFKTRTLLSSIYQHLAASHQDTAQVFQYYQQSLSILYPNLSTNLSRHEVKPLVNAPAPLSILQALSILDYKLSYYLQCEARYQNPQYLDYAQSHVQVFGRLLQELDHLALQGEEHQTVLQLQQRLLRYEWEIKQKRYQQNPKKKTLNEWLDLMEQGNSLFLQQSFQEEQAMQLAQVHPSLRQKHQQYRKNIQRLAARWSLAQQENDSLYSVQLLQALRSEEKALEGLRELLRREHPLYRDFLTNPQKISLAQIQRKLHKNQSCLLLHQDQDLVRLFFIFKDTAFAQELRIEPTTLSLQLQTFYRLLQKPSMDAQMLQQQAQLGYDWYQTLFGRDSLLQTRNIDEICIIPSGLIAALPFELLLDQLPEKQDQIKDWSYLIKRYQIRYALSLQHLVAPNYTLGDGRLLSLAWNDGGWLRDLTQDYAGQHLALQKLHREKILQALQSPYSCLHWQNPWAVQPGQLLASYSLFNEQEFLQVQDLLQVLGPRPLLVFEQLQLEDSSQTFAGLDWARYFQGTGNAAIILPRWTAEAQAQTAILQRFYQISAQGYPIAQALRQAQLSYLSEQEGPRAHPHYWANLMAVGRTQEGLLLQPARRLWPYFLLLCGGLSYALWRFWRKKKAVS